MHHREAADAAAGPVRTFGMFCLVSYFRMKINTQITTRSEITIQRRNFILKDKQIVCYVAELHILVCLNIYHIFEIMCIRLNLVIVIIISIYIIPIDCKAANINSQNEILRIRCFRR